MAHHFASRVASTLDVTPVSPQQTISGRSSRFAAMQMDIGNLVSMLLPPLPILWFGGSMLIYALHRHHPDPRVGHYTQRAEIGRASCRERV